MVLNPPDSTASRRPSPSLQAVTPDRARPTFDLIPRGAELSPNSPHRLARNGGELVGALFDDGVCTWLAQRSGQLVLMMWPRDFHARFDPLELLDDQGQLLATGGEFVTVVGGFLPDGDPRSLGHKRVFAASKVTRGRSTTP